MSFPKIRARTNFDVATHTIFENCGREFFVSGPLESQKFILILMRILFRNIERFLPMKKTIGMFG